MTRHRALIVTAWFVLLWATPVAAQFLTPVQVTPDTSGYQHPEIVVDSTDHVDLTFVRAGDVLFWNSASGALTNVTASPAIDQAPRLTPGPIFSVDIAYESEDPTPGAGNDIFRVSNSGGPFTEPQAITDNDVADANPAILRDGTGVLSVAWDETDAGATVVRFQHSDDPVLLVANGARPKLADAGDGDLLILYERTGAIFARALTAGDLDPEQMMIDLPGADTGLAVTSDDAGVTHAVFLNGGAVQYTNNAGGAFAAPTLLDAGPVDGEPRIAAEGDGHVAVVFARGGDVWIQIREGGAFGPTLPLAPPAVTPANPSVAFDSLGFIHAAYDDSGAIFYTNDVPAPVAAFTATPTAGDLPLEVDFANESTGVINSFFWDFGDGATSVAPNPIHVYTTPGVYTVSLTVVGPGGTETLTKPGHINAILPPDYVRIPSILVFAGQPDVKHPVRGTHADDLQGFQIVLQYDEDFTPINDLSIEGTITAFFAPEFFLGEIIPDGDQSTVVLAVILDTVPPFDGRTIPAGDNQNLVTLVYDVPFTLTVRDSSPISLLNGVGDPPISNIFSVDGGFTVDPYLLSGTVTVDPLPLALFLRGDFNFDQIHSLPDAIQLLQFLFQQGTPPVCPDSADFEDNGVIGIADAVGVLSFLFTAGAPPAYPYPGLGIDPTEDTLGPCEPGGP